MTTPYMAGTALHRTIWRWHFYAGLFVLPFILILSITGAIYLFKPQIDRWEERAWQDLPMQGAVSPDRQLAAVLAANPGARFDAYRLPARAGDAVMVLVEAHGRKREIYVSPQGQVLGSLDPEQRVSAIVARIHGSLLLGPWGDRLVELAASWTIVMILTGLYLWWPRPLRLAGTVWPRLRLRGRPLLKDLHRVTGFWISGLVLVVLASGLPWTSVWGGAFRWVRGELGLVNGPQAWKTGAEAASAAHDHGAMIMAAASSAAQPAGQPLSVFVAKAAAEGMAFPVLVLPPHAPQRFGAPTGDVWTVKSEAQNRWLTQQVTYDPVTSAVMSRTGFEDQHPIDRVVNTGVAWHEGALFGLVNQLIGLATALLLMALSLIGVLMWLKRRPRGELGAPPADPARAPRGLIVALVAAGLLLPLFGASLIVLAAIDRLIVRPITRSRRVGLRSEGASKQLT